MLKAIFWALVGIFAVTVSFIVVPAPASIKRMLFPLMAILSLVFFLLGLILILLTIKKKVKRPLRNFLILTGVSSASFFVSVLLHNFIYGLFIYFFGEGFWDKIGLGDEPVFFFLAILVCPLGFLVGIVGSVILFIKKR